MSFLYQGFQYLRNEDPVTAGGVTSIALETRAGGAANLPAFWPDSWLEAGSAPDQSIRRVVFQSDGKVWIGFRRDRSPNAYLLANVVLSFSLDDLEYRVVGLPALRQAVPDNLPTGGALRAFLSAGQFALSQFRWCQLEGSGTALYTELARRIAADEAISVLGAAELPGWDPAAFGHWYVRFAVGAEGAHGAWTMTPSAVLASGGGSVTQNFTADSTAPAAWARLAGAVPAGLAFGANLRTGECTMAFAAAPENADLLASVISHSQLDLTLIRKWGEAGEARGQPIEIDGPRQLVRPGEDLPSAPYSWVPSARTALTEGLSDLQAGDALEVVWRPGPVWRWWSGEGRRMFGGRWYEGALQRGGATLMEILPVEYTADRPDIRARIRVGLQSEQVRRFWQLIAPADISMDARWIVSEDGGLSYRDLGRGIKGRVSEPRHKDGVGEADVESWLSDDLLPTRKWSLEGGKERGGPSNRFFEHTAEMAKLESGPVLNWPQLR